LISIINYINNKREKRKLLNDVMFKSLCDYFNLSRTEGLKVASVDKWSPTPIHEYFNNLDDFSEENVMRGWGIDQYRALRNWYYHRNDDFKWLIEGMAIEINDDILDYGCSTSFFSYYCMKNNIKIKISLADVESPHFNFCKVFYKDFAQEFIEIKPRLLPLEKQYTKIILYDVLEHVPSPLKVCGHMNDHLIQGGRLLETFIQDVEFKNRSNLRSAIEERESTFEFLSDHFNLVSGEKGSHPGPRIWEKK